MERPPPIGRESALAVVRKTPTTWKESESKNAKQDGKDSEKQLDKPDHAKDQLGLHEQRASEGLHTASSLYTTTQQMLEGCLFDENDHQVLYTVLDQNHANRKAYLE